MDFLHLLLISSGTAMLFGGSLLLLTSQLKETFTSNKNDYLRSAGLGFLNPFLYYLVLLKAYSILPAQFAFKSKLYLAHKLGATFNSFIKTKSWMEKSLCILLSFSGVLLIANKGSFTFIETPNIYGILLALSSSLLGAFFWIFNVRDHRKEKLFLNFVFGFLYLLISILLFSNFTMPSSKRILATVYIGIVEYILVKSITNEQFYRQNKHVGFSKPIRFLAVYTSYYRRIYLS